MSRALRPRVHGSNCPNLCSYLEALSKGSGRTVWTPFLSPVRPERSVASAARSRRTPMSQAVPLLRLWARSGNDVQRNRSGGPHYIIGRPLSSHSLGEGVTAAALRDLPAKVSGNPHREFNVIGEARASRHYLPARLPSRSGSSTTRNCPIIPLSSCSMMWQWYMYGTSSGSAYRSKGMMIRTRSPGGTRTVSFQPSSAAGGRLGRCGRGSGTGPSGRGMGGADRRDCSTSQISMSPSRTTSSILAMSMILPLMGGPGRGPPPRPRHTASSAASCALDRPCQHHGSGLGGV